MLTRRPPALRLILVLWAAWVVLLLSFQALATARVTLSGPDRVLPWTAQDSDAPSPLDEPALAQPFLNRQVAYDSEYYLSIATVGYNDPLPGLLPRSGGGPPIPLNYAFFPLYPLLMRLLAVPLGLLGLSPLAAAALAGVSLSVAGTLVAMLALYDLTRNHLGELGAVRAAFYLLIFPTGFFLAQVYSEGVFVALAFSSLALMQRQRLGWASLLAALAVLTRSIGVALTLPLLLTWGGRLNAPPAALGPAVPPGRKWLDGLWLLLPIAAYLAWSVSPQGVVFVELQANAFGRGLLWLDASAQSWLAAAHALAGPNRPAAVYFGLEFAAIFGALAACAFTARRFPAVALFSLAAVLVPLTSGPLQSMQRYVLAAPAVFVALGRLGRHPAFDRLWTLFSTLLLALLSMLFAFNFWTA
jgi:hypothetical protein